MTAPCNSIKTAIIDDDEEFLFSLKEHLSFYPEIELLGCATKYKQAKSILQNELLELVFLDVEMPVKNGFELLEEAHKAGKVNFNVVFYTAYDKYVIQALRQSAFDYILKPVKPEELKNAIERYKLQRISIKKPSLTLEKQILSDIIALPAPTGIRFTDKNNILLFQCSNEGLFEKKYWTVLLTDRTQIKLRSGTSAKDIIDFVGHTKFIRVNQSFIVNINYLAAIEYKSRECQLLPPFNDIVIIASRSSLSEIREKFDIL
jgi:two-component system LytT family response regulator